MFELKYCCMFFKKISDLELRDKDRQDIVHQLTTDLAKQKSGKCPRSLHNTKMWYSGMFVVLTLFLFFSQFIGSFCHIFL